METGLLRKVNKRFYVDFFDERHQSVELGRWCMHSTSFNSAIEANNHRRESVLSYIKKLRKKQIKLKNLFNV